MPTERWLVGVSQPLHVLHEHEARTLRTLPVTREEEPIAAQLMIDEGDEVVYAFTRPIDLQEIAPVLARGDSIMEAFGKDIETLYGLQEH